MSIVNVVKNRKKTRANKPPMSLRKREAIEFYTLISPFIIMFIGIRLIPFIWGIILSFTNFTGFNYDNLRFIGFDNYFRVFNDNDAMYSLLRTLQISLVIVPMGLVIGFLLAILLNNPIRGIGVFRTIYYLPSIVPAVAVGLMWKAIYNQNGGLFNGILRALGREGIPWLGYDWVTRSLIIMMAWGAGGGILIYLAGLKGIPKELYESAAIDGARPIRQFFYITIPMMTPIIFYNLIMGIIGALQLFAQPVLLTTGSSGLLNIPLRPNYTYQVHVYQQIFANQRFGYGLAMIWIIFIIILILTFSVFRSSQFWVYYEVQQDRGE